MSTPLNPTFARVTARIVARSRDSRAAYLERIRRAAAAAPRRSRLSCGNLAHGFAACGSSDKADLKSTGKPNIAIVTAYNDMLSVHQPLERFPALIKAAVRASGGVAQVAGGVPAMCDGVTQGPKANGMPELHKLTPSLGVLQDLGYKVALVTDGRMSGASGKVPAALGCFGRHVNGCGRELFAGFRRLVGGAEQGASIFALEPSGQDERT